MSVNWEGGWVGVTSSSISYYTGDVVNHNNIVYSVKKNVAVIPVGSPSPDLDMSNWDVFASGANGTSGSSGSSGSSGNTGTSGNSGSSGSSGSSGTSATSGSSGNTGSSGTSGINGTSGTSGSSGSTGTSGSAGTSGNTGSSGTSGALIPAWTSAGAITLTATTTNPTKGVSTQDNISYRQVGAKEWEVILTYIQTAATGGNSGSGDYLITLPNGLSFDTTLPSQQIYTSNIGVSTWAHTSYVIPSGNGMINNGAVGGHLFPMVYSATKFRVLTITYGSAVQCWGNGYYSVGGDNPKVQLTFRFTST